MTRQVPKEIVILVDSREQNPLPFPATVFGPPLGRAKEGKRVLVRTQREHLETGDYLMRGAGHLCRAERKGSLTELENNLCSSDQGRQDKAITALVKSTRYPILVLDFPWNDKISIRGRHPTDPNEDYVWACLAAMVARYDITLLSLGTTRSKRSRVELGQFLALLFLAHYLKG